MSELINLSFDAIVVASAWVLNVAYLSYKVGGMQRDINNLNVLVTQLVSEKIRH